MVAIKNMEMPKNCIECNHMDIQQAINCQLIYSGCANCGRHPNCPLLEIGTCKDCKWGQKCEHGIYCLNINGVNKENWYCADYEKRGSENDI